jgi:putative spermidine/putrescine transport system substrate-binding protein
MKRNAALAGLSALALMAATACGSDPGGSSSDGAGLDGQQLVFVNYGGESMEAAQAAWLEPFSAETGVRFATDSPTEFAQVRAMVEAGNTTWDVVDIDVGSGALGCGTLFEKRPDDLDMSAIDPKYITDDCGVPVMVQSMALVYNAERFGDDPPTKVTDLLDTERFPGRRITLNYAFAGLEGMLLADGVEPGSLYPLDLDRAASVVQRLGRDLSLLGTTAGQAEALESGNFAMCWCMMSRAAISEERGANIGIVWDRAFTGWDSIYAVKGSKSPEAQQAFDQVRDGHAQEETRQDRAQDDLQDRR